MRGFTLAVRATLLLLTVTPFAGAGAVTLTFDDIAPGDYQPAFVTQGFEVTSAPNAFGPLEVVAAPGGGNYLFREGPETFPGSLPFLSLSHASGLEFTLQQMDVLFYASGEQFGYPVYAQDVLIQARDNVGGLIAETTILFTEPGWKTVSFDASWTGITTLNVMTGSLVTFFSDQGAYDNIVVTAVPVPAAVWLFGSGIALLGWLRPRSRSGSLRSSK